MTVTPASFRIDFSEFTDAVKYTDAAINLWLAVGNQLQNPMTWGASAPDANNPPLGVFDLGLELFVAHNLVLEADAQASAAKGGTPGKSTGIMSSKSAGPVSASYDTSSTLLPDAGHWNLTTYGARYALLLRLAGMGVGQINGEFTGAPSAGRYGGSWPGPAPYTTGETLD